MSSYHSFCASISGQIVMRKEVLDLGDEGSNATMPKNEAAMWNERYFQPAMKLFRKLEAHWHGPLCLAFPIWRRVETLH